MKILIRLSMFLTAVLPLGAQAQTQDKTPNLPACAASGASSVFINGRPMLRLSDVANCPEGMFEIVPGFLVEGEPAVRFAMPAGNCVAGGSADVIVGGTSAGRAGDAACPPK
ncbi:PAAR domain-containing protein [uncultured Roseibium sp.]|uniref:PAAR domain-containing protein n=1 Tax=uncultured Roseibium sp. TaxID=1936171 RepID=UPI0032174103